MSKIDTIMDSCTALGKRVDALAARRSDGGERTVRQSFMEQMVRDGKWEVVYEPDRNGRATVRIGGRQETIKVEPSRQGQSFK